jgi:hypothetical protein
MLFTADTIMSLLNTVACWLKHTEAHSVTVHRFHQAILFHLNVTQLYSTHVSDILVMAIRKVWLSLQ